nr:head GIN domain-containing protein [uncultured Flavobacterium sp.]
MKKIVALFFMSLISSCGISEDCFKNKGAVKTKIIEVEGFDKIKIHSGITLVVKQGNLFEVKVESGENIMSNIEVSKENDFLVLKDVSSCNWTRDYETAKVYVTAPNIVEIHSKTEQNISSDGVLTFPTLRLFSIDADGESGTGDFYFTIHNLQTVIESNHISNFYISGHSDEMLLNFYFGNGRFYGENFEVQHIKVFQRGSNDMIVKPIESIRGTIYSTGNIILKNNPPLIDINQLFSGYLILN